MALTLAERRTREEQESSVLAVRVGTAQAHRVAGAEERELTVADDAPFDADLHRALEDVHDGNGPLLRTSVSGVVGPLTRSRLWRTFARMPLLTLAVAVRIHIQALRLALKRVPFLGKNPATLAPRP